MAGTGYRTRAGHELRRPVAADGREIGDLAREVFGGGTDRDPGNVGRRLTAMLATAHPSSRVVVDPQGRVLGASVVIQRGHLIGLSLLIVREDWQGRGLGRELLAPFPPATPGTNRVILCSTDPKAMRRYAALGMGLHPAVSACGILRPGDATPLAGTSACTPLEGAAILDAIAAEARSEPYGTDDIAIWDRQGDTLHLAGDQAAVVRGGGVLRCAVARSEAAGRLVLRAALAAVPPGETVHLRHIRAGQDWAIDEMLRARLELSPEGPLFSDHPLTTLHLPTGTVF